jgi:isopenicillin N synthase-like dioxygenase
MNSDAPATTPAGLPIIDVSPLLDGSAEGIASVAQAIGAVCRTIGFFYIAGHGISTSQMTEVYRQSVRFFDQPQAAKNALSIAHSMNNRGYAGLASENLDPDAPADFKEAYNLGRAPEPDEAIDPSLPSHGSNQWPDLPGFRDVMLGYYGAMRSLGEKLHRAFAIDLGLPADYFAPMIDRPLATLRLLRYPALVDEDRPGAGAHTDYGNLTILAQDMTGGLQVQTRDGHWIDAIPVENTFVCNIGDCLMRWSNDIYTSTPHRVTNRSGVMRHSLAFFFDPNPDALIACLPTCQSAERPARYAPVTAADYLRQRLDATYAFRTRRPL